MRDENFNLENAAESVQVNSRDPALREAAWEAFFYRFDPFIRGRVIRALQRYRPQGASYEINDLVQQVYERLIAHDYRALRHFRGQTERALRAYLASICRNLAVDWCRTQAGTLSWNLEPIAWTEERPDTHAHLLVEPSQERELHRRELQGLMETILRQMGDEKHAKRDRRVFILRHYQGYSAEEVAQELQITVSLVNTICSRVRKRLILRLSKILRARTTNH